MTIRVSTSLIWPHIAYQLTTATGEWIFGHPIYWARKKTKPDCSIDRNMCDKHIAVDSAVELFYEYVADSVIWPKASDFADDVLIRMKSAEKDRQAKAAGHLEMF